ncbi:hypothetical protein Cgig2_014773 [Carnegiea gigantea]|uniref:Probable magnesium transporter n=1 Tax=Carnegiea gigantea TaxID=171969 RepID=A0A9Q1L1M8_9CARY|nr:hypothetical protein Cgig2_014773 [Carnegiea gigantea]
MAADNVKGLILAVGSSLFIGSSFILKKKGLRRAAAKGTRAGYGGYSYLLEPLWWAGLVSSVFMLAFLQPPLFFIICVANLTIQCFPFFKLSNSVFIGEVANFVAYVYAPAVLVTPLGALSIIISAVLAHFILKERLPKLGILGCVLCIAGSVVIVLHAPQEQSPTSVQQIWAFAAQPAFVIYMVAALSLVLALILHFEPRYGQSNVLVYIGICSLMGSLTVVSIKAIGIAIKLTLEGKNQLIFPQTWFFVTVGAVCVITQLNYLNKVCPLFTLETNGVL